MLLGHDESYQTFDGRVQRVRRLDHVPGGTDRDHGRMPVLPEADRVDAGLANGGSVRAAEGNRWNGDHCGGFGRGVGSDSGRTAAF